MSPSLQMYYDDLPVWGFLGKVEKIVRTGVHKYFLFTHFHFDLSYNDDKVIEINVSSDPGEAGQCGCRTSTSMHQDRAAGAFQAGAS